MRLAGADLNGADMNRFRRLAALSILCVAALATIATSPPYEEEPWWSASENIELDGVQMNSSNLLATWEYQVRLEPGDETASAFGMMDLSMIATIDGAEEETEIRVTIEQASELLLPLDDSYEFLIQESHELAFGAQAPYSRTTSADVRQCTFEEGPCDWYFRVQVELVRGGPVAIDPVVNLNLEGDGFQPPVIETSVGQPVGFDPAT